MIYAASKSGIRWVQQHASGDGRCRHQLNAVAHEGSHDAAAGRATGRSVGGQGNRRFPGSVGDYGDAGQLADWMVFMLSDAADFLCGSVIVIRRWWLRRVLPLGIWPLPVPSRMLPRYALRILGYRRFMPSLSGEESEHSPARTRLGFDHHQCPQFGNTCSSALGMVRISISAISSRLAIIASPRQQRRAATLCMVDSGSGSRRCASFPSSPRGRHLPYMRRAAASVFGVGGQLPAFGDQFFGHQRFAVNHGA